MAATFVASPALLAASSSSPAGIRRRTPGLRPASRSRIGRRALRVSRCADADQRRRHLPDEGDLRAGCTFFFALAWQPGSRSRGRTDRVLGRTIRNAPRDPMGVGAGVLTLLLTVGVAVAAAPTGPRLAVVKWTWNPSRVTLVTVDPSGSAPVRLAGGQEKDGPLASNSDHGPLRVTHRSRGARTAPRSPSPALGISSWREPTGAGRAGSTPPPPTRRSSRPTATRSLSRATMDWVAWKRRSGPSTWPTGSSVN